MKVIFGFQGDGRQDKGRQSSATAGQSERFVSQINRTVRGRTVRSPSSSTIEEPPSSLSAATFQASHVEERMSKSDRVGTHAFRRPQRQACVLFSSVPVSVRSTTCCVWALTILPQPYHPRSHPPAIPLASQLPWCNVGRVPDPPDVRLVLRGRAGVEPVLGLRAAEGLLRSAEGAALGVLCGEVDHAKGIVRKWDLVVVGGRWAASGGQQSAASRQ